MSLVRRVRALLRGDRGTTLTELNVTMLIMGVIVAATVTLVIGFQRTNAQNISRQDQIDSARSGVEAMSATLRSAVKPVQLPGCASACPDEAFLSARDFSVQFFANLDNPGNTVGPSRVTYEFATTGPQAGQLIESIQRPMSSTPTSAGYSYCDPDVAGASVACKESRQRRVAAFGVVNTEGPLFTYYNKAGVRLTPPAGGSLTMAEMSQLLAVEIRVAVKSTNATSAAPTEVIQRVNLPNAQALIRQQQQATP